MNRDNLPAAHLDCIAAVQALESGPIADLMGKLIQWHGPQPIATADGFRYRCCSHGSQWPCHEYTASADALGVEVAA